jgi:hypothetical protein
MRAVANKRGEPALWKKWAMAAFNLSNYVRGRDPGAARTLLGDMAAVALERDEPALVELYFKAALRYRKWLDDSAGPDAGQVFFEELTADERQLYALLYKQISGQASQS